MLSIIEDSIMNEPTSKAKYQEAMSNFRSMIEKQALFNKLQRMGKLHEAIKKGFVNDLGTIRWKLFEIEYAYRHEFEGSDQSHYKDAINTDQLIEEFHNPLHLISQYENMTQFGKTQKPTMNANVNTTNDSIADIENHKLTSTFKL